MLKTLQLKNFTSFGEANFQFCPGLNVIIGQNGTGKTKLLRAAYLINRAWPDLMLNRRSLSRKRVEEYFSERLQNLFQPISLNNLIRKGSTGPCIVAGEVEAFLPTLLFLTKAEMDERLAQFPFGSATENLRWEINVQKTQDVALSGSNVLLDAPVIPDTAAVNSSVPKSLFLPTKEIVSIFEGLLPLLDRYEIKLDATYRDLAMALNSPKLTQPPRMLVEALAALKTELGGSLHLEKGRLIFIDHDGNRTEGPLMAEGFAKLATLLLLFERGIISEKGETLFWDEPETGLNATYIRLAAAVMVDMAKEGLQVILATHNLFLMREIEVLGRQEKYKTVPQHYIALSNAPDGIHVSQGESLIDIDPIVLLDEDLAQSDRYMETME
jgi:energy-coupling factor transporter ATP-binding protein EcfA2